VTHLPSFHSRLAAVLAGELISKACVVGAIFWLARRLDPAAYGEVEWVLSLTMVGTVAADAGLTSWASARVAAEPSEASSLVARVGALRLALAAPVYAALLIVAWSYGGRAGSALAICGLVLFLTPLFLQYLFNGLFQPRWAAFGQALRGATFAVAVVLFVHPGSSPSVVAVAELLGAAALALCSLAVLRMVLRLPVATSAGRLGLRSLLSQSWTIGASEIAWGVHWYVGLILLGVLATTTDAAWHAAGLRLALALHTIVWLYLYVLLPNLARLTASDPAGWAPFVERSLRVSGWAGVGIALGVTLGAEPILATLFGAPFAAAAPALRATIWIVPIAWMSGHIRYSLIAAGHPWRDCQAALAGAGTTIVLTLALVPFLQSTGAGLALVGGTAANAIAASWLARGVLPPLALGRIMAIRARNAW
jgi:O-antigen/teichoic acid export membrane protein